MIIYLIPISLLIMNVALSGAYTHHVKTLRDAVRTWDAITPSVPAHSVSRRYSISFLKKKIWVIQKLRWQNDLGRWYLCGMLMMHRFCNIKFMEENLWKSIIAVVRSSKTTKICIVNTVFVWLLMTLFLIIRVLQLKVS